MIIAPTGYAMRHLAKNLPFPVQLPAFKGGYTKGYQHGNTVYPYPIGGRGYGKAQSEGAGGWNNNAWQGGGAQIDNNVISP